MSDIERLKNIGQNKKITLDEQWTILNGHSLGDKMALSLNPKLLPECQTALVKDGNLDILVYLAQNPSLTESALEGLLNFNSSIILENILNRGKYKISIDSQKKWLAGNSVSHQCVVANAANLDINLRSQILTYSSPYARIIFTQREDLVSEERDFFIDQEEELGVICEFALRADLSEKEQRRLLEKDKRVMKTVLLNPKLKLKLQKEILQNPNPELRFYLSNNPNLSPVVAAALCLDQDQRVGDHMRTTLENQNPALLHKVIEAHKAALAKNNISLLFYAKVQDGRHQQKVYKDALRLFKDSYAGTTKNPAVI